MISCVTAPYVVRVHSAADALAKLAVMRRYNATHNQHGDAFTEVSLVRPSRAASARRRAPVRQAVDAPTPRYCVGQAMAVNSNGGSGVQAVIDLPEGAGWTNDDRFALKSDTPELVLCFRWVVPNFPDGSSDGDSRVTLRELGGVMTMAIYLDISRLPGAGDNLLVDASALEKLAAAAPRRALRSEARWDDSLMR